MRRGAGRVWCVAVAAAVACGPGDAIEPPAVLDAAGSPFTYPEDMWDREYEGEVVLLVHVTAAGAVDSVYVHETSGFFAFDSAALADAKELKFAPGRRGKHTVSMWAQLPVRFTRDGRASMGRR
jgi:TonB family protein